MKKWLICPLLVSFIFGCKTKTKEDSTTAYFSVVAYLSQEVKQMDSLPLHFTKIVSVDSTGDTTRITKEEFRNYAKEFLTLPDISSDDNKKNYTEMNDFDEALNTVLLMYTAKREDAEVRRETVMMEPAENSNARVKTILVNTFKPEGDSTVEKNMTWHIGRRFQIVTKTNKPNHQEKINTVMIQWE